MINTCPNALSFAAALATSFSIMSTEAVVVRKLQTYACIPNTGGVQLTRSEVMVQPTLGDDQQPIPKSVTTTYPYEPSESPYSISPTISFTKILSGIGDGVSSVDQFETDESGIAQKYTKVLKVGDEGIFRFIHNLEEKELVIEVRGGMTDKDSVAVARRKLFSTSLEPLTKIACPGQLSNVLEAAVARAGNLGSSDHFVALATIEVEKIEVNERTFMRLIASGDQPPELQRLGQSLFVNDEALLTAAASAYIQVHLLKEDLQQQALNELFVHNKPVGYVVHVEDDTQVYPVPEGYPKLEITEAPGEDIFFHGQMQRPDDVAFVEKLYKLWLENGVNNRFRFVIITDLLRHKIKNYQFVIRNRQMALLEEIVARHDIGVNKDQPMMLSNEDKLAVRSLADYESLQLALALAAPDNPYRTGRLFEFTLEYIRSASSVITLNRMYEQLEKHFGFKPVVKNLLMNPHFFQHIRKVIPVIGDIKQAQINPEKDEEFTSRVMTDMARQLLELSRNLEDLRARHATPGMRTEAEKISATKARFATIAAHLNIEDFDSDTDIDVQQERLIQKLETMKAEAQDLRQQINTMTFRLIVEDFHSVTRKNALAQILGIDPNDNTALSEREAVESAVYTKLNKLKFLDTYLDYIRTGHSEVIPGVLETLSDVEKALQMTVPDENDDVYLRRQSISEELQDFIEKARQRAEEKALAILKAVEEILDIKVNAGDDKTTRLIRVRRMFDGDDLTDHRLDKIDNTLWADENAALDGQDLKVAKFLAYLHYKTGGPDPDKRAREQQTDPLAEVEEALNLDSIERKDRATRLAMVLKMINHPDAGEYLLSEVDQALWKEDSKALDERGLRLRKLDASLTYKVEDPYHDKQVREQQADCIAAVEGKLHIHPLDYVTGIKKVKAFAAKLASDLRMNFDKDASLSDQKDALIAGIQSFRDEINEVYEDATARRARNNEVARQLNIKDYNDDASINDQNSQIKAKLQQLDDEVIKRVQPDVNVRILIIEKELDRHMACLGPKPRYVLDPEVATASKQGVKVPEFRKVIQMPSDEDAEQFMEITLTPVTATGPAAMKESVAGMKEYAAAVTANYVLDDLAFENGRRTAAFLANVQETLTPYAHAAGLSESELIQAVHDTLMQAHAAAVEQELNNYWVKPSAFLVQAVTWYYSSYKPLLMTHTARQAAELSLSNMAFLYLLDLTYRGDYLHRMLTPFQHWLERYGVDLDRTGQYAYHSGIEQISEVGGLAMPLGKAASSVILLGTGSTLFARQHNANPHRYRSISRLVPEIVKSMGSGQGVQVPLLHRVTPQKVKTLASATAGLVLGPVATVGAYAHGLISGFTYAQTFGFALASSLTFDFFMNDNKILTQWLGGPLGRSLDKFNRWRGVGESHDEYVKRTAIATPQYFSETDKEYAYRVKANNTMYSWTRHENYLQFRERRDRNMRLFENGWEKYFRENVPKWSFSHAESIPYSCTLGALFESGTAAPEQPSATVKAAPVGLEVKKFDLDKDQNTRDEL
ncbi:hypothetical protein [Endozoicomonas sp. 8E]|uniref:hypothetical protein n=1 Tax=Endozoicomonas sp. 8E TaxID=3035692 RepID=UPI0029390BF4|nr:hypothetical protein [Endozoicomonas sp. 8E]WOG29551.1 hypothetical protein P6910_07845 [Endozoicomonas sp. 8E]